MQEIKAEGKYAIFDSRNLAGNKILKARPSKIPLKQNTKETKHFEKKKLDGSSLVATFPFLPTYNGKWIVLQYCFNMNSINLKANKGTLLSSSQGSFSL